VLIFRLELIAVFKHWRAVKVYLFITLCKVIQPVEIGEKRGMGFFVSFRRGE
jgi:hypothetical protein